MSDDATPPPRPTIRLRPKGGRRLAEGAPWVYRDELVLDRRTKKIPPGTIAVLEDTGRAPLGLVAVNPDSVITARLLDRDVTARIDRDWLRARLTRALSLRETLFDAPFYRLVHAEADGLPGVVIDRFDKAVVVQANAAWADRLLEDLFGCLTDLGAETIVVNTESRARALEGLTGDTHIAVGALDGPVATPMNGATYMADLIGGQKTGLYFDQRPNHAFAQRLSAGGRVLDVFSHVGGFGLAALAGGAKSALSIDGSAAALTLAEQGAAAGGMAARYATRKSDAFKAMEALAEDGETFDLVICDPPAFVPNKQALNAGLNAYRKVARQAARLVAPGGFLCLCSCSHAADAETFRTVSAEGIRQARREGALIHAGRAGPDHPVHPHLPETGYLKALFFRLL